MGHKRKKKKKRGYPIALIISFGEKDHTFVKFWEFFSEKTKPYNPSSLDLGRKIKSASEKQIYAFFEKITQCYRPILTKGIQTIILITNLPRDIPSEYLSHIQKHYRWMMHNPRHPIQFGTKTGNALTIHEVDLLRE